MIRTKNIILYILFSFISLIIIKDSWANGKSAIGQWKNINTYNQVNAVDYASQKFYVATNSGVFIYHKDEDYIEPFSKANGMNDIGVTQISFDPLTKTAVVAYKNSNIDLWKGNKFENISDIRLSNIAGDKTINHISSHLGKAYVSTGFGLVIIDIKGRKIDKTIHFYDQQNLIPINQSTILNNHIYIATDNGIYSSSLDNNMIENGASWQVEHNNKSNFISQHHHQVIFSDDNKLFKIEQNNKTIMYEAEENIQFLDANDEAIWFKTMHQSNAYKLNTLGNIIDSVKTEIPSSIITLGDNTQWIGDKSPYNYVDDFGFRKFTGYNTKQKFMPKGPGVQDAYDLDVYDGRLYIAHGAYDDDTYIRRHQRSNFSSYINNDWRHYYWLSNENYIEDFTRIVLDPHSEKFYVGSASCGLLAYKNHNDYVLYDGDKLPAYGTSYPEVYVGGMALDKNGNLWITTNYGTNELNVLVDEEIIKMKAIANNGGAIPHSAMDVIIDDWGHKWFTTISNNAGLIVYDDKGTIDDISDDRYRVFQSGAGRGNLPSSNTKSVVKDLAGNIWVGTDNGIGIFYCAGNPFDTNCEAYLKKVTNVDDDFVGHLFQEQIINTIAVDYANRKWIGTPHGAWLVEPDGEIELLHFNENNSPLPSSFIRKIKIDPANGDVYFITDAGIAVYRGDTKEVKRDLEEALHIYPNPVPANYQGQITIDNLTEQADIRITDVNNNLVYKTVSRGGRATWDGYDYTGAKAQSGVYIVYVLSKDGSMKQTGKFIIYR